MYKTKLSEQFVIAIFIISNLWISKVYAQIGNCNAVGESDIKFINKDIKPGFLLETALEIEMERTVGIVQPHTENPAGTKNYLSVTYSDETEKMLIATNAEFLNYEVEQNQTLLEVSVFLNCQNERTVEMFIFFAFEIVNNFAPKFSEDNYEIEIPLPLPIGIDIFALINKRISATDNDLYNNKITFTSDIITPFRVDSNPSESCMQENDSMGKQFYATIKTIEKILNIKNAIEFKITATDSGEGIPRSSEANVKVTVESNDEELVEVPIFDKSLYIGTLDFLQENPLNIEPILLSRDTYIPLTVFKIELGGDNYFGFDQTDNKIELKLNVDVKEDDLNGQTQLSFVVKATRPDGLSGNVAVLINIIPKKSLVFDNAAYKGIINLDMTITHDPIKLTNTYDLLDIEFSIIKDDLGWFEKKTESNVNEMEIQLIRPLSDTDLEGKILASLTIEAKSLGNGVVVGESRVIFGIEREDAVIPAFEKSFYEGILSADLEMLHLDELKLVIPNIEVIEYTLSNYNDLFEAIKTTAGVEIKQKSIVPGDIADKETLQFTVTAETDKGITGSTVVILKIERVELVMPVFKKQLYTGHLKRPISSTSLELEELLINPHEGDIEFFLTGDDTHLIKKLTNDRNSVTLGLDDDVTIDDRTVLTVIVNAKLTDALIGTTVVIIHVEQEVVTIIQPEFEKNIYHGNLSESHSLILDDSQIKLTQETFSDTINFSKIGDDAAYFSVQQTDNTNNVEIRFDAPINLEDLAGKNILSFSIVATLNGDHIITGTTTVIIELPKVILTPEIIPTFEHNLYAGTLKTDLTLDLAFIRVTQETGDVTFALDGFDSDLFRYEETTPGTIEISNNKITTETLENKQLFKFYVRATNKNNNLVGITAVVIEFPGWVVPQFEMPLYSGELSMDMVATFADPIKLTSYSFSSDVRFDVVPGFDGSLFSISDTTSVNNVDISTNGITEDILKSKNALKVVISATEHDALIGYTVLIINVPADLRGEIIVPEFELPIYHGSLPSEMDEYVITVKITDAPIIPGITFTLKDGDDSGFFRVREQNGVQATIMLNGPLEASQIQGKTVLSFIVEAISDVGRGTTTVIINIPDPSNILPLIFERSLYVGALNTDFTLSLQDAIGLTDGSYSDGVTFNLVNEFDSSLFSISDTTPVNNVDISTTGITEDILKSRNVLKVVISATKPGALIGYTVLIINVPADLRGEIIVPEFELPIYHGSLPSEMDEYVITVKITDAPIIPGITFTLKDGDDSGFFRVREQNGVQATIMLNGPLEASQIQGKTVLSFIVEAISDVGRGTTTVIINIPDPSNILPLIFERSLYVGALNTDFTLSLQDAIGLTDGSYSDGVTFNLVNEFDSSLFSISDTTPVNNVDISTTGITEDILKSRNVLKVVISATKPGALIGYTVLIINVPADLRGEIIVPEFELPIYYGSLPSEMDEYVITVKITDSPIIPGITFTLKDGDDSGFFRVREQNGVQATIMLNGPLEASQIQGKTVLSFIVEAISDVGRGTTTVIINIPDPSNILPLIFERSLYVGALNTDFTLSLQDAIGLTDRSYSDGVTFNLVNEFDSSLFSISDTTPVNNVDISTTGITEDILKSRNVLKVVISATKPGALIGYTVLIINVPADLRGEIIVPEFELPIYHGSLPSEMDEYVITVKITDAPIIPGITFTLKDGDDSGFFRVREQNGVQATIMLNGPLEASQIQGKTVLSFIVEAISDVGRGTTTVIINIPDPSNILPLIFERSLYVGALNTDFTLSLQDAIGLTDGSYSDGVTFNLVNEFDSSLFSISDTTPVNNVDISTTGITEDILKSRNVLKVVISATKPGALIGYTVLIINVPADLRGEIIVPEFELPIYHGSLPSEMDEYAITVKITDEPIIPGITFRLKDGDDSGFFRVREQNGVQATIMLNGPLEASQIQGKTVLSFIVEAISDVGRGTTTVIINIPDPSNILPLIFERSLYVGALNTDFTLSLQDAIGLTDGSYSDGVTFNLVNEFDSSLFSISDTTPVNNVDISTTGITEDILKSRNVLKVVISATKPGALIGYTVLIINVPADLRGEIIVPEFELPIYHGSLPSEMDEYVITVKITDAPIIPGITFRLKDGDDSGFFRVREQNGVQATIMLNGPLEASQIQGKTVLSFIVEAISDVGRGTTTVIINIPDPSNILPLIFERSLYVGALNTDFTLSLQDAIGLTDGSYSDGVTFNLVNEFDSSLFSISDTTPVNNVDISTTGITEDILKSRNVLKVVISATKPGALIGYTVLIINVPADLRGEIIVPEFELPIYHGSLPSEMDEYAITVKITDAPIIPGITFRLKDGDDSGFFRVREQNGVQATIMLNGPLEASQIQGKTVLSFIVEAISDVGRGTTTVIINIPDPSNILPLIFERSLYVGALNTDFTLSLQDAIGLTDGSYSDGVTFNLVNEFDSSLFSISDTTPVNNVDISTTGITEDILKSRNVLKVVISATKPGALIGYTVLIINVPADLRGEIIVPEFELPIYHGSLPSEMDEYVITVKITDEPIIPGITFRLKDGDDSGLFRVREQNGVQATIMLNGPLEASQIQGKTVLSFIVEAISDVGRGTTTVIIDIPDPSDILPPIFKKTVYVGSLSGTTELKLTLEDSIALTDGSNLHDIRFDLEEFDSEFFEVTAFPANNIISINVKGITEEVIKSRTTLKVIIRAMNTQSTLSGITVVVVELKSTSASENVTPRFEQPLYEGVLSVDLEIEIQPIRIANETFSRDITVVQSGADQNLFEFGRTDNVIIIRTVRELTESDLKNKQVLSIALTAALPSGEESSTVVIFQIPYEGCRIPNEETKPKFDKDLYEFIIEPAKIGLIETLYAEVREDTSIEVTYGTQIDDLRLSSKIGMKRETGDLSITEIIPPGIYYFMVTARNPKDNSIGFADIKLTITSIIFCSEEPTVSHSLIVKHFEEEQAYSELLNVQITEPNCQYEIVTVTPISLWDIFTIEGDFLKSESFDRESKIFEEMVVPQISLILGIFCNDATLINGKYVRILHNRTRAVKSTKDDSDDNYYVYTNDIIRDDKKMILSIVIKDINDNSPVFENPDDDILIGYPESQLAEKLLPPHLTKVYATDKDEGINGQIKYSVNSNPHFGINPETGVIYPLKNSMDDILEYTLVVKATDEEGTGLVTSLNIEVKRLEEKHFIVISVENEILDNLDAILLNIETQVGLQVKVLNAVIVSTATDENAIESRSKRSVSPFNNGEQTVLRIIGYAFNVNKDPIENTELESMLSELTDIYTISTQNLTELIGDCEEVPPDNNSCEPTNDECDECDNIGFIIGLIILVLLLLLACIIIFAMWWKWIRPYRYVKRKSSNERLAKDFNDTGYTEPVVAPTATTSEANIFGRANFEIKNENVPAQVTPTLPHSSPASLAKSLHNVLDTENRKESLMLDKDNLSGSSETDDSTTPPPRERKKSIKFNETVERIDILDDVTEKEDTSL